MSCHSLTKSYINGCFNFLTSFSPSFSRVHSAELINASPTDVFWGSGRAIGSTKPGVGRNELGKALSRTRDQLLNSAGLGWGSAAKTV